MTIFTKAFWLQLSSPKGFYPVAGKMLPWFAGLTVLLILTGLYWSFFVAPEDYQQGNSVRILYIHVAAAWMSMLIYAVMAGYATIGLIWNTRLSNMMAIALAPTGAMFTFLALWTGAFWGKPTWGTYWVWDARITSELMLLFLYMGYMALYAAIDDPHRAARASALLALVGVINLPIIYYSVEWWNTLHQPASVSPTGEKSHMDADMKLSMFIMAFAFWMYTITVVLARVRNVILERERHSSWVEQLVENPR